MQERRWRRRAHGDLGDGRECSGESDGWPAFDFHSFAVDQLPQLDDRGGGYPELTGSYRFDDATGFGPEFIGVVRSPHERVRTEKIADLQTKDAPTLKVGLVRSTPGFTNTLPAALPIHADTGFFALVGFEDADLDLWRVFFVLVSVLMVYDNL